MIDSSTPEGARALAHLETDVEVRVTTTTADGRSQTAPVWFLWRDGELLVYSKRGAKRLANVEANPAVELSFRRNRTADAVSIEAEARHDPTASSADKDADYLAKYGSVISSYRWTPESFVRDYPDPIRIRPIRVKGG